MVTASRNAESRQSLTVLFPESLSPDSPDPPICIDSSSASQWAAEYNDLVVQPHSKPYAVRKRHVVRRTGLRRSRFRVLRVVRAYARPTPPPLCFPEPFVLPSELSRRPAYQPVWAICP